MYLRLYNFVYICIYVCVYVCMYTYMYALDLGMYLLCEQVSRRYTRTKLGLYRSAVLNLWAGAHWWAAHLCLVGRDHGWEWRIFSESHVSQSMKRYQVL